MESTLAMQEKQGKVLLSLWVKPRASKDRIGGVRGGALEVSVTAPPNDGKANAAVCALLAKRLDLGRSFVRLVSGASSRQKRVEISGLSADEVASRLGLR